MQKLILAGLLSALICMILGPVVIPMLKRLKFGQTERDEGPQSHLVKQGTPTMGGILFMISSLVATLIFSRVSANFVIPALLTMCAYGLVGFLDDFIKVRLKRSLGLRAYQKIIAQFGFALIVALYAYNSPYIGSKLYLAFFNTEFEMGVFYIPFVMLVIISTTNAVNLTDGLDGLASGVTLIYSITMALIFLFMSTVAGQAGQVEYAASLNGIAVFAAAIAGGCLGFLRFNSYPAKIFMGDTGSLALGGAISMMAICSRSLLLLPIMGGCFVASAVSVILQVGSFKLRHGKRIFKMAPLHHHFELKGYGETKIVSAYMIITTFLCLVCLLAYA